MVRTLTVVVGIAMSLVAARETSAIPIQITPVDLDSWVGGSSVIGSFDDFHVVKAPPPPPTPPQSLGSIFSEVFYDGFDYTYVHTVTPRAGSNDNEAFRTDFSVRGFTGIVGWSFSDALRAGGTGTESDFRISNVSGRLWWIATFPYTNVWGWTGLDPIAFFFVSHIDPFTTLTPPTAEAAPYLLLSDEVFTGRAQSLAPVVPEPGSIALFGSGLVGLYAAVRRRRSPKE
jgi:hypothetical protein